MTGDELPTTPGSIAEDEDGNRFALNRLFWGVRRWVPLTQWERRAPDADELAERNPTVLFVAPEFAEPGPPRLEDQP